MASVAAVLLVILGVINILNYRQVVTDAHSTLELLSDNNGVFPGFEEDREQPPALPEGEGPGSQEGEPPALPANYSPETPYETRYFSILLDENGEIIHTDFDRIAAVDSSDAGDYASQAIAQNKKEGFLGSYRYMVTSKNNTTMLLFLDCSRSLETCRSFLITSILIALTGLLAVFLLVFFFSKRIIRPFAENYEKQKRFITDAGHEIKTPLTIIDADASVLEMETGENEWLADIQKQTVRLRDLTNDLIFLARMEESQASVPMVEFPISEAAEDVVSSFRGAALARNLQFKCDIQPMITCTGDSKSIRRLFSILLDNALKYTNEGGLISFTLKQRGKGAEITVFNTCESIDPDQLPHLFERFYRTDKSRSSKTGGHGIGLSIAQAIVQNHKGKIQASTSDGRSLQIDVLL